jgi:hypothetical protein
LRLARGARALARIARAEAIELVHANTLRASVYAAVAARIAARPLVWHVRDMLSPGLGTKLLFAQSRAVVAVSQAVAAQLPASARIRVIANGVRIADFGPNAGTSAAHLRDDWAVPRDAPLVGQVARLEPWKGQRAFLEAAASVLLDHPDARFAVVGGDVFASAGSYPRELEAWAAELGVSDRIHFAGHQENVTTVLAALDVLVHASEEEPFGRILAEAAAAGVPAVAFASGGAPEIVVDGETGLLVAPGDVAALAAGVGRLLGDADLRLALGCAARHRAECLFDADQHAREMEDVFEAVLGGNG